MTKAKYLKGFTVVELITVMVLLGIVSVFAVGKVFDQNQFAGQGFYDDMVTAVRFAQKLAVSTGCDVAVNISAIGYTLSQRESCSAGLFNVPVMNPANRSSPYSNHKPTNYNLTPASFVFNEVGVIGTGPDINVTLSDGPTILSFTVYSMTGLVDD